jgi:hypothetical protein
MIASLQAGEDIVYGKLAEGLLQTLLGHRLSPLCGLVI